MIKNDQIEHNMHQKNHLLTLIEIADAVNQLKEAARSHLDHEGDDPAFQLNEKVGSCLDEIS